MLIDWLSRLGGIPRPDYRHVRRLSRRSHLAPQSALVERLEDRTLPSYFFGYAFQIGENFADTGNHVASDTLGNVYVTGTFQGTVDFNPDPANTPSAIFNLTGGAQTGFLAKYSPTGSFLWAVSTAGPANAMTLDVSGNPYLAIRNTITRYDSSAGSIIWTSTFGVAPGGLLPSGAPGPVPVGTSVTALTIDNIGNVISTGWFAGTQDFDPSATTVNLASTGQADIFISKLNSSGGFVWAFRYGGSANDVPADVATDLAGNVHVVGSFISPTIVFTAGAQGTTLTNLGTVTEDVFVFKLDQAGTFVWARSVGSGAVPGLGSSGNDRATSVAVDSLGNVYTSGEFQGTVDFNPAPGQAVFNVQAVGTGTQYASFEQDVFVFKLDSGGLFANNSWAVAVGGGGVITDVAELALDVAANSVFLTGTFAESINVFPPLPNVTADFNPSPSVAFPLTTTGNNNGLADIYLLQLTTAAGTFVSASQIGGTAAETIGGLALDSQGSVFTTGAFSSTVDFDPTTTIFNLTSSGGNTDAFLAKYIPPGLVYQPSSGLVTTESGASATFTVSLATPPTGNVTINLTSSNLLEGVVTPPSLTFTPLNWNIPQTVTVTGIDDPIVDGDIFYSIITGAAVSADPDYNGLNPPDITILNRDNDGAGINLKPGASLVTSESGTGVGIKVSLNLPPTSPVTVALTSSNVAEGVAKPNSLIFTSTNWNIPQSATIQGVDDSVIDGTQPYVLTATASSLDSRYAALLPITLNFTNTDNDIEGIIVNTPSGLVTSESGGQATFAITLNVQPSANVTINLHTSNAAEGTIFPSTLVFNTLDWNTPHGVIVTGVNDAVFDGSKAYTIVTDPAVSTDPHYDGFNPVDISVTNLDNESTRMFRAYNPNASYHFFTTSAVEFNNAVAHGYNDETTGRGGFAVATSPGTGLAPLHRMYSPPLTTSEPTRRGLRFHYYTTSDGERDSLVSLGWTWEKDEGYIYTAPAPGTVEVFRLYNRISGTHLFTENAAVKNIILAQFPGIWVQHSSLGFTFAVDPSGSIAAAAVSAPALAMPAIVDVVSAPIQTESAPDDSRDSDPPAINVAGLVSGSAGTTAAIDAPVGTTDNQDELNSVTDPHDNETRATDEFWSALGRELAAGVTDAI